MGTFNFYDKRKKRHFEFVGSVAEAEELERSNKDLEWLPSTPLIHSGRGIGGMSKPDGEFRDRLKEIKKKAGRRSTINTWG